MSFNWLIDTLTSSSTIATLIFLMLVTLSRFFVVRWIRITNRPWTAEQRLKAVSYVRSVWLALIFIGLLYIWGEQVHSFALYSITLAFAFVFAIKELLVCLSGSFIRFRGTVYDLGDRIEINGLRGDVIDMNLMETTLLEIGPAPTGHQHTGRKLSFPNSWLISHSVINESFLENFYLHNIRVPLLRNQNWHLAQQILLETAKEECAPYLEQARRRLHEMERRKSIVLPAVDPRVSIHLPPNPRQVQLFLRFPAPAHLRGRLEQAILSRFMAKFHMKQPKEAEQTKAEGS